MSEAKGGNNIIIIILAIFISVLLASGASYFMFTKFVGSAANSEAQINGASKELGTTTAIGQFLVNLADGRRFIKVNIVLEVSNDKVVAELTERQPQIRDAIITILRGKDNNQINSNEGVRKLRTEIMNKINQNLIKGKVTNVFFTEFVVQ
jgi:flagellar FliL protein